MGKYDIHLKLLSNGEQQCAHCSTRLSKPKDGSTKGYSYHFSKKHPEIFDELQSGLPRKRKLEVAEPTQPKILDWATDRAKTHRAQRAFAQIICTDSLPLQLSEKVGCRNFLKIVAPGINFSGRNSITRSTIPDLFEEYQEKLKAQIKEVEYVSLSFDMWSNADLKHEVMGVIIHFIFKGDPVYRVIGAIDMNRIRHTSVNIQEKLEEIIDRYGIYGKVVSILRDGAANVSLATRLMEIPSWDCFVHKLNLVMKVGLDAIPGLIALLEKMKKLVRKVHKSSVTSGKLEEIQEILDIPKLRLVKNVEVRWGSTYDMVERFIKLKEAVQLLVLQNCELPQFTNNDWSLMVAVKALMEPTHKVMQLVQNRGLTASSILPLCVILSRELRKNSEFKVPSSAMAAKIDVEHEKYKKNEFLRFARATDPRFKFAYGMKMQDLIDYLIKLDANFEITEQNIVQKDDPFSQFLQENSSSSPAKTTCTDRRIELIAEVEKWNEITPNVYINPFEYWSNEIHRARFPNIYQLNKKYLGSPLGSVEVERMFSVAKNILTDSRNRLTPANFERLIFLKINIPLLGF